MTYEYRSDGWPLCPKCGADELMSKASNPTPKDALLCLACLWHGTVPVSRWVNIEVGTIAGPEVHTLPIADTRVHGLTRECWCAPGLRSVASEEFWPQVIHNSNDGRELVEEHGVQ